MVGGGRQGIAVVKCQGSWVVVSLEEPHCLAICLLHWLGANLMNLPAGCCLHHLYIGLVIPLTWMATAHTCPSIVRGLLARPTITCVTVFTILTILTIVALSSSISVILITLFTVVLAVLLAIALATLTAGALCTAARCCQ